MYNVYTWQVTHRAHLCCLVGNSLTRSAPGLRQHLLAVPNNASQGYNLEEVCDGCMNSELKNTSMRVLLCVLSFPGRA